MRKTLMVGQKLSVLGIGGNGGGFVFKTILVAADFPTVAEADADLNTVYVCGTDPSVIDNDPTKTNTNKTILFQKRYVWDVATQYYYEIGGDDLWLDDGTDYKTISPARNIDLQNKGLKDTNVTTEIKIGDSLNTALNTINKTFAGAINELQALIDISTPIDLTSQLGAGGVTVFTIPLSIAAPASTSLYYNGKREQYLVDYTISGTTLTKVGGASYGADDGVRSLIFLPAVKLATITSFAAFKAQVSTDNEDITGDGTPATVLFQNDSSGDFYDLQNNYNPATGQYTAAFDQIFNSGVALLITGVVTAHDVTILLSHKTSGGSEISNYPCISLAPFSVRTSLSKLIFSGAGDFKMSVGDTLQCVIVGINSGKSIDVINTSSQFYGHTVKAL